MGFGAIVGALASKGLDVGASALLQHNQANLESRFYRHRHQNEVRDLRAAGLNPVLSALNGASGGLNVGIVGTGDTAQSAAALHNAYRMEELLDAQTTTEYWKQQLLSQQTTALDINNEKGFETIDSDIQRINSANLLASQRNLYDASERGMGYYGARRAYEAFGPVIGPAHSFADTISDTFSSAKQKFKSFLNWR